MDFLRKKHRLWSPSGGLGKISRALLESLGSTPLWEPKCKDFLGKSIDYGAQAVGWENFKSAVGKPRVDPPMGAKM